MVQVYKFLAEKGRDLQYMEELKIKFLRRNFKVWKIVQFNIAYQLPNGVFHNNIEPSISDDKTLWWFKNNKIHRNNDLPALIYDDGDQRWYQNDLLHRNNDKPTILHPNGEKSYHKFGVCYIFKSQ